MENKLLWLDKNRVVPSDNKIYELSQLKLGDIFNYIPLPIKGYNSVTDLFGRIVAKSVAKVTRAKFNHTSQVTGIDVADNGNITIIITEALPKVGVQTIPFNPKWLPNISIIRITAPEGAMIEAAAWWRSKTGARYDGVAAVLAGFRTFINIFRRSKLIFDNVKKYFCSNGIALGALTRNISISNCDPSQCVPGDINRDGEYGIVLDITKELPYKLEVK